MVALASIASVAAATTTTTTTVIDDELVYLTFLLILRSLFSESVLFLKHCRVVLPPFQNGDKLTFTFSFFFYPLVSPLLRLFTSESETGSLFTSQKLFLFPSLKASLVDTLFPTNVSIIFAN